MGAAPGTWLEKGLMPTNNKMGDRDTNSTNSGEDSVIIQLNSIQNIKILWDDVNENIYLAMIFYGVSTLLSNYKLDRFNRK